MSSLWWMDQLVSALRNLIGTLQRKVLNVIDELENLPVAGVFDLHCVMRWNKKKKAFKGENNRTG